MTLKIVFLREKFHLTPLVLGQKHWNGCGVHDILCYRKKALGRSWLLSPEIIIQRLY